MPSFSHFKNHQSSLDNHQSIPRAPRSPSLRLLLPLRKSTIITRQSSIHSSRSPFALPPPSSSSTSKITNHHSPIINPFLASPFALPPPSSSHFKNHQSSLANHQSIPRLPHSPSLGLLLPLQKSPIITRQSSVHSSRSPFAPPSPSSSHIKNHQSSLANHQFIPRLPCSPSLRHLLPHQKSPIITRQSSIQSSPPHSPYLRLLLPTSKITNHHLTIFNLFLAIPIRPSFAFFLQIKNHQSSLANHQSIPRVPCSPYLRLVLPLQKSPIITRQSSIHSLAFPVRLTSAFFHIKNHQSSLDNHQSIPCVPHSPGLCLLLPLQKSPIITRQSSIHSLRSPFALPPPSSSHFKNHQSSLDNHQSIPRLPHSPSLRLLLPLRKSPIITRQSSIHSSRSPFAFPPPSSSTSKITNHHSPLINPFLASPFAFPPPSSSHFKNHQSSLDNLQSNGLLIAD